MGHSSYHAELALHIGLESKPALNNMWCSEQTLISHVFKQIVCFGMCMQISTNIYNLHNKPLANCLLIKTDGDYQ